MSIEKPDREYLLELDKKRTKIEGEILSITEYLSSEGMPGVSGPLTDSEGFPISGVDLMAVRTARNKLIMLQNDLTNLMLLIEKSIASYFSTTKESRINVPSEKNIEEDNKLISVGVADEIQKESIKIPFAYLVSVIPGSPAEECGLTEGDAIIKFDRTLTYGSNNNPLQKIAEIVGRKVNTEIEVEILRNGCDHLKIQLIPHQWSGQGLLGCKLNLTNIINK